MITLLGLVNFKKLRGQDAVRRPFTVIVGANASGKSKNQNSIRKVYGYKT